MGSYMSPILAWSKVTGPGEANFWAHNLFETALESPALPLLQSGLTSMLKIDRNRFLGPFLCITLTTSSFWGVLAESWTSAHRARRSDRTRPKMREKRNEFYFRSTRRSNIKRSKYLADCTAHVFSFDGDRRARLRWEETISAKMAGTVVRRGDWPL